MTPRGRSLRDIQVTPQSEPGVIDVGRLFGYRKGLDPSVDADKTQLAAVLQGIEAGAYSQEAIDKFVQENPRVAAFVIPSLAKAEKRVDYSQYFNPQAPVPFETTEEQEFGLPPLQGNVAGYGPKADVQGAILAALGQGDEKTARGIKDIFAAEKSDKFEGPVLFDTSGKTYRATKDGKIVPIEVEGGATIAPPVYPFTTVDPKTGQPINQVITKPDAARRAKDGASGLGPAAALKPLPKEAQENMSAIPSVYRALDDMERVISKSGRLTGIGSKVGVFFGTDEDAIKFDTARNNLRVQAQAMIKGIPSNYDVQTFLLTIGDLLAPESVNKERIKYTRDVTDDVLKASISYYKGTGYQVPRYLIGMAKRRGIDLSDIGAWDGNTDPFEELNRKYMSKQQTEPAKQEKRRVKFSELP